MKSNDSWLIALILTAGLGLTAQPVCSENVLGETVADFELTDLAGEPVALYDLQGDIVVLNFFATWCVGCIDEAESLENSIWLAFRDEGLTVVAVDIMEQTPLVESWVAALGLTYEVWLAPDWTLLREFPQAFGIPYNAVIDRNLILRYAKIGFDETV